LIKILRYKRARENRNSLDL